VFPLGFVDPDVVQNCRGPDHQARGVAAALEDSLGVSEHGKGVVYSPLIVAEDVLHSGDQAIAERTDLSGVFGHLPEALLGVLAPLGAAHVDARVAHLFVARSACAERFILEKLHRLTAVRTAYLEYVFRLPEPHVLARATG